MPSVWGDSTLPCRLEFIRAEFGRSLCMSQHTPRTDLTPEDRSHLMDPTLQAKLAELVERMLADGEGSAVDPIQRQRLHEMRDALDSLRLSVKYLAFDLEATRRENAILRKELTQRKKR